MAKFKDLSKNNKGLSDRSAGDRYRHVQALREAMKQKLPEIIKELDIFSIDRTSGKKYKVPIKLLEEFRFVYDPRKGNQSGGIGQKGNPIKGEHIGKVSSSEPNKISGNTSPKEGGKKLGLGDKAGDMPGEIILELTPEDIDFVLAQVAQDLSLPFLDPKKSQRTEVKRQSRWKGLKENGIEPRLDLEASFTKKVKRQKMLERRGANLQNADPEESHKIMEQISKNPFPFIGDDLQYHGLGFKNTKQGNVLLVAIADISGSMTGDKIYWSKAFLYALYHLAKKKYQNAAMIFIVHHTEAEETDSATFLKISSNGGTHISSGPRLAIDIIKKRYPPERWDIYTVHCSDGENSTEDNPKAISSFKQLLKLCKLVGFIEVNPGASDISDTGKELNIGLRSEHFKVLLINKKDKIREKINELLRRDVRLGYSLDKEMKNG